VKTNHINTNAMKTTSLLCTFCLGMLFLFSCGNNSDGAVEAKEQLDTTITVQIDTSILFSPETYQAVDTVISERYDTTVTNEAGEVIYQSPRPERMMNNTPETDTMQ
jgi:PBP1b-binding outer membrane lipoprotein LpoB